MKSIESLYNLRCCTTILIKLFHSAWTTSFIIPMYFAIYVGEKYVVFLGEVSRCICISLPSHSETKCIEFSKLWLWTQLCLIKQNATQKKLLKINLLVYVTLISEAKLASWSNFHMLVCFLPKSCNFFYFSRLPDVCERLSGWHYFEFCDLQKSQQWKHKEYSVWLHQQNWQIP